MHSDKIEESITRKCCIDRVSTSSTGNSTSEGTTHRQCWWRPNYPRWNPEIVYYYALLGTGAAFLILLKAAYGDWFAH